MSAETTAEWMRTIPAGKALSFYLHVPFCRRLCWFCACRTQGTKTLAPVASYVQALERETALAAQHIAAATTERLHIGGGTPTLLPPEAIETLTTTFFSAFPAAPGAEFSVEIDPTEIDLPRLSAFASAGMNRASLGVQDFDPKVQAAIGREQSYEETEFCTSKLKALGVDSINLDILYGLPFQTSDSLRATVNMVIDLNPDRIAAFGYAHVPWVSRRQTLIPEDALPTPQLRLRLFYQMADMLKKAGYIQIGIDHFVKPQDALAQALAAHRLHRNFQGYTDDANPWLIGLGASAISRYPQGYLHNATSTSDYAKSIEAGDFATKRGIAMTSAQILTADLIENLMCYGRIDLDRIAEQTGRDVASARPKLDAIATEFDGLVQKTGDCLHVPTDAYPMLRVIAAKFDDHAIEGQAHAVAI